MTIPKKSCPNCGIVDNKHRCPVSAKEKQYKDALRQDKKIYWSKDWIKKREEVNRSQDYICLFSFYVLGTIASVECVHHIVEIDENVDIAFEDNNLIGLTKDVHDQVHEAYRKNKESKQQMQELLRECNKLWGEGVKMEGISILKCGWDNMVEA